jgi:uncharacterized membrane protein
MTEQEVITVADEHLDGNRAWCHVAYGLHALSAAGGLLGAATIVGAFVFGWPSIIAVILNYLKRGEARGSWLESHWRWQLRTFWFAVLWCLIAALLVFTLIGIPLAWLLIGLVGLWVLYRVVRGWLALADRKALPLA